MYIFNRVGVTPPKLHTCSFCGYDGIKMLLYTCLVYERRFYNECSVAHMYGMYSGLETYTKRTGSRLNNRRLCILTNKLYIFYHLFYIV